jgi:hypothetical protein
MMGTAATVDDRGVCVGGNVAKGALVLAAASGEVLSIGFARLGAGTSANQKKLRRKLLERAKTKTNFGMVFCDESSLLHQEALALLWRRLALVRYAAKAARVN